MPSKPLQFIQYNVLSPCFTKKATVFPDCDRRDLEENTRFDRVWKRIAMRITKPDVPEHTIVGLQEVNLEWAKRFTDCFAEIGMNFHYICYGEGYKLGVGLAYPKQLVKECHSIKVTALRLGATFPCASPPYMFSNGPSGPVVVYQHYWGQYEQRHHEWASISDKQNHLLALRFAPREGAPFLVATYHMPCAFMAPNIMLAHTVRLFQWLQHQDIPYVLLTDFNQMPDSDNVRMLLGTIPPKADATVFKIPGQGRDCQWRPVLRQIPAVDVCMPSIECTTWARPREGNEEFVATLDYIFYSRGDWKDIVTDVDLTRDEIDAPGFTMPNASQGSDHAMVVSTATPRYETASEQLRVPRHIGDHFENSLAENLFGHTWCSAVFFAAF